MKILDVFYVGCCFLVGASVANSLIGPFASLLKSLGSEKCTRPPRSGPVSDRDRSSFSSLQVKSFFLPEC